MTYQEFNHIYFKFTSNKRGIKPQDQIQTTGYELKEFLDYAIKKHLDNRNQLTVF